MALIVRIDVDRPYGRSPVWRHICSRVSSNFYFPKIEALGYLTELKTMLQWLNERRARSHVFFRQCTLPSPSILEVLDLGGHQIGLHLEDSRSFETFADEKRSLERHIGRTVTAVSKHGSGRIRYGRCHYAPYEPEKYIEWAGRTGMNVFFGNLKNPALPPVQTQGVRVFPSAFWLEPAWRDTKAFPTAWLKSHARVRDVVMLVHPENVLSSPALAREFRELIGELETTMLS